ncbi:MAG: alpha/beta fold hydrolase [Victivallaceae bacterium]|nr:alpha/beta fold hydrolase [Victivallaceae bacterium]
MNSADYKYIDLDGISIAYTDSGSGQILLFVHGFASFSFTWRKMLGFFPENLRKITIDLKGYGYSEKRCDDFLSPFDQSQILAQFIRRLELNDIYLIGHSMGGAIALLTLFNPDIREKVRRLVLIDTAGLFQKIPDFIDDLSVVSPSNPLLKLTDEDLMARLVLEQTYFDKEKITAEIIREYADVLRQKDAKNCLIRAARQIAIANIRSFHKKMTLLKLPALLIWGEEDNIIDLEDAFLFFHDLPGAKLKIIPACGHSPQEEQPRKTAEIIAKFLHLKTVEPATEPSRAETEPSAAEVPADSGKRGEISSPPAGTASGNPDTMPSAAAEGHPHKLKMRRLFDYWNPGTIVLMIFIKCLQLLKKIGFKAEENGWRKASGIFMRKEHAKFILASFRLTYAGKGKPPPDPEAAKELIINRLADFLLKHPATHWASEAGIFMNRRKKVFFTDLTEVRFSADGRILKLVPHFDTTRSTFTMLTAETMEKTLKQIVFYCNKTYNLRDPKRARKIYKKLFLWVMFQRNLSMTGQHELRLFISRILNGAFIQFETLTDNPKYFLKERLATPNTRYRRHPGFGLLNIICRFTPDLAESDLWFQYHHVPVDGMPMQEMLEELKAEWGSCGQIKYPALSSPAAEMELYDFGHNIFRARIYLCFDEFLELRKKINEKYYSQMSGPATIASMLVWGLAQYKELRNRKFLFPVDTSLLVDYPQDRDISLVIIRPGKFFDLKHPLEGFLRYQREFNRRLFATRLGKSETYELLELYALIHPLFYYFASTIMPKAMAEAIGTAGLTILRNAEMFISPLTDVHFNGFIAIGNMKMPTEDGSTASAISFCGSKEHIMQYIEAMQNLPAHCRNLLNEPAGK